MLSEYDINKLKIDKAFVNSDLEKNKKIISHLVELSKELNIETIAEGVENEEEYNFLKKLGCNNIQGYYLSRPISVEDFKSKILNK
jgi:EAL domain-containing protein (putative c-di-GMP-specific phosphodiesterase class I)